MKRGPRLLLTASMFVAFTGVAVGTATTAHAETNGVCYSWQDGDKKYMKSRVDGRWHFYTCRNGMWRWP